MLTLYRLFLYLALPVFLLRLVARGLQNKHYFAHLGQRFGVLSFRPRPHCLLIHAVSVGEVNAATPLIHRLRQRYPQQPIMVTTMTPTGRARAVSTFGTAVGHCYLPYDYPGAVRRFLRRVKPRAVIIMETELWPNLIHRCQQLQTPVVYANFRLSKRSQRGYQRFRRLLEPTLQKVTRFAVQDEADAQRLRELGAVESTVSVTGNLKFDLSLPANLNAAAQALRQNIGHTRPVWIAASTHAGEESQVLDAFAHVRKSVPELLLLLVPRHPERFAGVYRACTRLGFNTVRRTEQQALAADVAIYLGDSMGELPLLLAASDIAFIGGSLVARGGHNLLEACAVGVPVVFGPHTFNFAVIAELVVQRAAGVQVNDATELATVVTRLLGNPRLRAAYAAQGQQLVHQHRGALEKIHALVAEILE